MKKFKITSKWLFDALEPCSTGVQEFEKEFPNGVVVSDDQQWNFRKLQDSKVLVKRLTWLCDNLDYNWYISTSQKCTCFPDCEFTTQKAEINGDDPTFFACGILADLVGVILKNIKDGYTNGIRSY